VFWRKYLEPLKNTKTIHIGRGEDEEEQEVVMWNLASLEICSLTKSMWHMLQVTAVCFAWFFIVLMIMVIS